MGFTSTRVSRAGVSRSSLSLLLRLGWLTELAGELIVLPIVHVLGRLSHSWPILRECFIYLTSLDSGKSVKDNSEIVALEPLLRPVKYYASITRRNSIPRDKRREYKHKKITPLLLGDIRYRKIEGRKKKTTATATVITIAERERENYAAGIWRYSFPRDDETREATI